MARSDEPTTSPRLPALPTAGIDDLSRPWVRFARIEAASGVVLLVCAIIALVAANSAWSAEWSKLWDTRVGVGIGGAQLDYPLWYWINDGLMAVFFFVVGLEIKRELVHGELRDRKKVVLPVAAALGGALVPAGIYAALLAGQPGAAGWAVPMATDIAFVVGALALLGSRVPAGLKVFLLSLAIVDDLLAVGVIAVFLTEAPKLGWLSLAALLLVGVAGLNRLGVRNVGLYVLVGGVAWLCTLKSGIHPTVAGAALGLLTPAGAWLGRQRATEHLKAAVAVLDDPDVLDGGWEERLAIDRALVASREARAPLERIEAALHPWVGFLIMPVFALANAGVPVSADVVRDPVAFAAGVGLVVGKPVGILVASWVVVALGVGSLPRGVDWKLLAGAGCLAGIGFTMSLFIAGLSLADGDLAAAKTGVLLGSIVSGGLGFGALFLLLRRPPSSVGPAPSEAPASDTAA